jgi:hypothetical protein
MKCPLTDIQKGLLFKKLAGSTLVEAGLSFGLDKYYDSKIAIKNAVQRYYGQVLTDPDKYGVSDEIAKMVQDSMYERYMNPVSNKVQVRGTGEFDLEHLDEKNLVLRGKKMSWLLLNKKLNAAAKSKKELDKVSIPALASVAGITFDKAQIVNGEATENIALRAKIDENISVDDAINEILKRRESV